MPDFENLTRLTRHKQKIRIHVGEGRNEFIVIQIILDRFSNINWCRPYITAAQNYQSVWTYLSCSANLLDIVLRTTYLRCCGLTCFVRDDKRLVARATKRHSPVTSSGELLVCDIVKVTSRINKKLNLKSLGTAAVGVTLACAMSALRASRCTNCYNTEMYNIRWMSYVLFSLPRYLYIIFFVWL